MATKGITVLRGGVAAVADTAAAAEAVLYPPSFGLTEERCDELAAALVEQLAPAGVASVDG